MIRTEALTKFFGPRRAVDQLDLEIGEREVVGFLGLNGAGKTTALRLLAGLLAPSSGRVFVDGQDMSGPRGHAARARIGFLPDRPPVYEEMTVRAYVSFAGKLRGNGGSPSRVAEVLSRTGLDEMADEPIGHLSHGYRQRVGIAQAIVHDPALVILDEPTSGLDPRQIVDMRTLIRGLRDDHTVLLSSHNLGEVSEICDQLIVIDEGRLKAQGTPAELAERLEHGADRYAIDVRSEAPAAEAALRSLEANGLSTAGRIEPADAPGTVTLELVLAAPPERVSRALFEAGLDIVRMQPSLTPLETLFAELTRRAA